MTGHMAYLGSKSLLLIYLASAHLIHRRAVINHSLSDGVERVQANVRVEKHCDHFQGHGAEGGHFWVIHSICHNVAQKLGNHADNALIQEGCLQCKRASEYKA